MREPFHFQPGHLTPVGLFDLIAEHPNEVIVLDDLASVFRSDVALQILLSALEHPTGTGSRARMVRYKRHDDEQRVYFRGGIVCISNRELHDDELLGALKSRVHTLNYNPSDVQLGALMLDIAAGGWPPDNPKLPPGECVEVAHFVLGEMLRLQCRFDLRLFVNKALPLYRQWKDGETESEWRGSGDGFGRAAPGRVPTPAGATVAGRAQAGRARLGEGDSAGTHDTGRSGAGLDPAHGEVGARVLPAAGRDAVTQLESVKLS